MDQVSRGVRGPLDCSLPAAWITFAMLAFTGAPSPAQTSGQLSEYDVKAAFLLNFARFVTWPSSAFADPHSPFAICILGNDPFDGTLDQLVAGESVEDRKVTVQRLKAPPPPKACQILFISSSERDVPGILEGLGPGVLTVSEQPDFLRAGGIIRFAIEDRHVRFDINQRAAANAALTLSARLLGVARSVQKE
jgi:YfiR/HmsC-like